MSIFTDLEKDAASVDGFVNENALITTRRNGPKPSWQYIVDQVYGQLGYAVVGSFVDGFTYTGIRQVGVDASGNTWIYTGGQQNLPHVVPAGTVPSAPDYFQVSVNSADNVVLDNGENLQQAIDRLNLETDEVPKNRQAIEALYKSQGYNNVFFFEDGFTYTDPNDVGVYSDGTAWTYADENALPVTIAAGTVPSEGVYALTRVRGGFTYNIHDFVPQNERLALQAGTSTYDCYEVIQGIADIMKSGDTITSDGGNLPVSNKVVFTRSGTVIDIPADFSPAGDYTGYLVGVEGNIYDRRRNGNNTWFSSIKIKNLRADGWSIENQQSQSKGIYLFQLDHFDISGLYIQRTFGNPLKIEALREGDFQAPMITLCQCNGEAGIWFYDTNDITEGSNYADRTNNVRFHGLSAVFLDASAYILFETKAGLTQRARNIFFYGPQLHHYDEGPRNYGSNLVLGGSNPVLVHNKSAYNVVFSGGNIRIPGNTGDFIGGTLYLSDTEDLNSGGQWSSRPNEVNFVGVRFSAETPAIESINADNANGAIGLLLCEFAMSADKNGIVDTNNRVLNKVETRTEVYRDADSGASPALDLIQINNSNTSSPSLRQKTGANDKFWTRFHSEVSGLVENGPDSIGYTVSLDNEISGVSQGKNLKIGKNGNQIDWVVFEEFSTQPESPPKGAVAFSDGSWGAGYGLNLFNGTTWVKA